MVWVQGCRAPWVLKWLAHRVTKPGERVRHALVIGGPPGVGKDTIVEAVVPAYPELDAQRKSIAAP